MQYSLIPGTNQLVYKNPGMGSQLFNQYGYDINRPRWRDYYNMLRGNQGLDFATSLAQLLTKVWPSGPHATGTTATAPTMLPAASTSLLAPPSAAITLGSSAITNNAINHALASSSSFNGFMNNGQWDNPPFKPQSPWQSGKPKAGPGPFAPTPPWHSEGTGFVPGPDPITRIKGYHELLQYAEMMQLREQNPNLVVTEQYLLPGQFFPVGGDGVDVNAALGLGPAAQQPDALPPAPDNFFYAHKKLIIGVAAALVALIIYYKVVK